MTTIKISTLQSDFETLRSAAIEPLSEFTAEQGKGTYAGYVMAVAAPGINLVKGGIRRSRIDCLRGLPCW